MATRIREDQASLLNNRIDILEKNAVEGSPLKQVLRTVGAILALVRDKMIANDDSAQLADYCFDIYHALKDTIQVNADDLGESARTALNSLERVVCEIEQTLSEDTEYDKGKIEGHKLEIQRLIDRLNTQSLYIGAGGSMGEHGTQSPSVDSRDSDSATTSVSEQALERLIRREFEADEFLSLIERIFVWKDVDNAISSLSEGDTQSLIDVMDEALNRIDLSLPVRVKCFRRLYRTCGRRGLLPETLKIPVCYDRNVYPLYQGGYADVWKGEHCGQEVAVKVIRIYRGKNLQKTFGRFCKEVLAWKSLRHHNILPLMGVTMSEDQFAMISGWMENGNINEFVKQNPDADRLGLLRDVAEGLIYIHRQGMIHGDLKGANILIDQAGHACLADFGLLTVISDPSTLLPPSSNKQVGTMRWMSPELIAPQRFGLNTGHPTKSSDCYSLGMVVYETISGNIPFHEINDMAVFLKVVDGGRPCREVGFTDSLWEMVEQCWVAQPGGRPSVESVLQCLEMCSAPLVPHAPGVGEGIEENLRVDAAANPPLFPDRTDWSSLPPEFKKEGSGWFAIFNPRTERVLDVSLVHTLAHKSFVRCVRFSADGKYLATACDQTVQVYDTRTGSRTSVLVHETADNRDNPCIWSICLSPDGELLATGAEDKIIRIWSIAKTRISDVFRGHTQRVNSLVFSPDGRSIISGSMDGTVRILDMTDKSSKVLVTADSSNGVKAGVTSVAISSDGRLVAAGTIDTAVHVWDASTGEILERLWGHEGAVWDVAFTPDARGLVSGGSDKMLKYWDISRLTGGMNGRPSGASERDSLDKVKEGGVNAGCTKTFIGHKDLALSAAVSHDGRWVVSVSRDRGVRFWDATTSTIQFMLQDRRSSVISVDLSPAGGAFATGSVDRLVRVWRYYTTS